MCNIFTRLKEERERLEFSQDAFAAVGGVKRRTQINYEKGDRCPDGLYLEAISKVGADVQFIVTGLKSAGSLSNEVSELVSLYQSAPVQVKAAVLGALTAGAEPDKKLQDVQMNKNSVVVKGDGNRIAGNNYKEK